MPLPGRLHEGGVGHETRPQGVSCGGENYDSDGGGDDVDGDEEDEEEQEDL